LEEAQIKVRNKWGRRERVGGITSGGTGVADWQLKWEKLGVGREGVTRFIGPQKL